jgi:hypothetical protein
MKTSVRITLIGTFALTLFVLSPYSTPPAHALLPPASEIILNSSTIQIVHNSIPNTDVLNASLDVTNLGDAGSCDGGDDDFLASGFFFGVSSQPCGIGGVTIFSFITYVKHTIGSASYGTHFFSAGGATVASKIVTLATPPGACGRWNINFQATGVDLSAFTSNQISLILNDKEGDATGAGNACFNVNAEIGNGITKPHRGVHHARH